MPNTFQISRRSFIRRASLTAAATGLPLWFVERDLALAAEQSIAPSTSPNDRPGLALIGCGGQGTGVLSGAAKFGNVVAVCDVKEGAMKSAAARFTQNGQAPATFTDFRKILERKDVDIIFNGTPDHWHSLINIGAARVKKDVVAECRGHRSVDGPECDHRHRRENQFALRPCSPRCPSLSGAGDRARFDSSGFDSIERGI